MPAKLQKPNPKADGAGRLGNKSVPNLSSNSQASLLSQKSLSPLHKSWLLVVLGANPGPRNDFLLGDFCGFKAAFTAMGYGTKEQFWSTYNLLDYCTQSKYGNIKVRGADPNFEKVVYSRDEPCHRQDVYTQKDPNTLVTDLKAWLTNRAREALGGDVINLILIAHGNPHRGSLQLGTQTFTPTDLSEALSWFQSGVQVNVVSNACGSGLLCKELDPTQQLNRLIIAAAGPGELSHGNGKVGWVKGKSASGRFRSSYFTDVIVKSLAKINLDKLGPTIAELEAALHDEVYVKPLGDEAKSNPRMVGSTTEEADVYLQKVLHLDYLDMVPDSVPEKPQETKRQRKQREKRGARLLRRESDMSVIDPAYAEEDNIDDTGVGSLVTEFFKYELNKTKIHHLGPQDDELYSAVEVYLNPRLSGEDFSKAQLLRIMAWRLKVQSSFFSVYMFLQDLCAVSFLGFDFPLDLSTSRNDEIRDIVNALSCFSFIQKLDDNDFPFDTISPFGGYSTPLLWLAGLIVRGAIVDDLGWIFDRIRDTGEFGTLDVETFHSYWQPTRKIKVDPKAGLVTAARPGEQRNFCWWLPDHIGPVKDIHELYNFFDCMEHRIESLYFDYFRLTETDDARSELLSRRALQRIHWNQEV